jgi:DNA topoisomerase IB
VEHEVEVKDRRLARIVRECHDLPGHHLFEYIDDDGVVRKIGSADVNEYLKAITGSDFTANRFGSVELGDRSQAQSRSGHQSYSQTRGQSSLCTPGRRRVLSDGVPAGNNKAA